MMCGSPDSRHRNPGSPPAAPQATGDTPMIEALKDDRIINELGGRFKFTSLVQHRVRELMDGARPLVERDGRTDFEIAVAEVVEGKITLDLNPGSSDDESAE